jgi:hypothetical protein
MSDSKQATQEKPQPPGAVPPKREEFRYSSEQDIPGRLRSVEFETFRHNILQENFASKNDIAGLDRKLTGQIADLDRKLTGEIADLGRKLTGQIADLGRKLTGEIADLDRKLTGEIAGLSDKLTSKMTSSNRFVVGSFLSIMAVLVTAAVLVLNWLWDVRGKLPDTPAAPVVQVFTTQETPSALPPQAAPGVTRTPDRQPPAFATETMPAPSAPASIQAETASTEG